MRKTMKQRYHKNESGLVSIFIVIFSALLVTIVTVSFVSLMIRNQQQATNADLSNSAYDAALAGVEDAKRLLLIYRECKSNPASHPDCDKIVGIIENSNECNMVKKGLGLGDDYSEVLIRRDESGVDDGLNQAYTCVKIKYLSDGISDTLKGEDAQMIPMEASEPYSSVRISWQKKKTSDSRPLSIPSAAPVDLPQQTQWQTDATKVTPALLRAQWIQTGTTFKASDFDFETADRKSNTNTLFLYPSNVTSVTSFGSEIRASGVSTPKSPYRVGCTTNDNYQKGAYACSVTLSLPSPITNDPLRANTYLRLNAFYTNPTDYKIELLNSTGNPVEVFSPTVDSTGRANDLFRRVKARISFTTSEQLQPSFDIDGDLCKNFRVTDKAIDYKNECNP